MKNILAVFLLPALCLLPCRASAAPHDYFNALTQRSDCFKAYSFRPQAGQSTPPIACEQPHYAGQLKNHQWITYLPTADPEPQRQDAAKVFIPLWFDSGLTLASSVSSSDLFMTVNGVAAFERGRPYKLGNEIVFQTEADSRGPELGIARGQAGTTAAAHPAGTPILRSANSVGSLRFDIATDGRESATYVYTWDGYWTDSYIKCGLDNHKSFQIASWKGGEQWWEVQTRFSNMGPFDNPGFNPETDAFATTARCYSQWVPPVTRDNPVLPLNSTPFNTKANKWTRFWVVIEANAENDVTKFTNVTTLAAPISSPASTSIRIEHPSASFASNPFSTPNEVAGASWPGRSLRIGSEIMTIVSGELEGEQRNVTVVRGAYGTTPVTHAVGAPVQLVHDYVSMYVADEDRGPVKLYDRIPLHLPTDHATESLRGSIGQFWLEYNTSTQELRLGLKDLVAYARNLVVLKNPADINSLLLRPQSGGVPPPPPPTSACDLNGDSASNVSDVQLCANQALGMSACTMGDINGDSVCSVADVQRVVNAALGGTCVTQ